MSRPNTTDEQLVIRMSVAVGHLIGKFAKENGISRVEAIYLLAAVADIISDSAEFIGKGE